VLSASQYQFIFVSTSNPDNAAQIARALVEAKAAACVSILPAIRSIYRWKDEIQDDNETLLMIKGRVDATDRVEEIVRQHHPYEVPEMVAIPWSQGHAPYLHWLEKVTA